MRPTLLRFCSVVGSLTVAVAATAGSAGASAHAVVIEPASIERQSELRFGAFVASSRGTLILSVDGTRSSTGGVVLSPGDSGEPASFIINGDLGAGYSVNLPRTAVTLHAAGSSDEITVTSLTTSISTESTPSGGNRQTVSVGGTLSVPPAVKAKRFSGAFAVHIAYH